MISVRLNPEFAIPLAAAGVFSAVASYFVGKSEFVRGTKFGYDGGYNDACCKMLNGIQEANSCVKKDITDMIDEMQTLIDGGTVDAEKSVLTRSNLSPEKISEIIDMVANGRTYIRDALRRKYLKA